MPGPPSSAAWTLVNNAGIQHVAPVQDFRPSAGTQSSPSTSSAFHTTPGLARHADQGWGRIINLASVHGLVASANKSAYVAPSMASLV